MSAHQIVEVAAVSCAVTTAEWPYLRNEAAAIEADWRRRIAATPDLWNGRVLLLADGALVAEGGAQAFRGRCFETDFKSFLGWRDAGFPPAGARNIFSMAALESADGAFILGEMAAHTAPAGQVYFPSGTPDPKDVVDGHVDLEASARRELQEETGLAPEDVDWMAGLTLVMSETRLCAMKRVIAPLGAEALVARLHAWLAQDAKAELARMHVVRSMADVTPAMPSFVADYLGYRFGRAIA